MSDAAGFSLCPKQLYIFPFLLLHNQGDRGGTVVKMLCYQSEGRWFDVEVPMKIQFLQKKISQLVSVDFH